MFAPLLKVLLVVGIFIISVVVLFYSITTWGSGSTTTVIVNLVTWGVLYLAHMCADGLINVYESEYKDKKNKKK